METTLSRVRGQRERILTLAQRYGVRNVRVFGSVARGDDTPESDIDLLVELSPGHSLLDLGGLLMDLQDLLERPVDLATSAGLREQARRQAAREAVPL